MAGSHPDRYRLLLLVRLTASLGERRPGLRTVFATDWPCLCSDAAAGRRRESSPRLASSGCCARQARALAPRVRPPQRTRSAAPLRSDHDDRSRTTGDTHAATAPGPRDDAGIAAAITPLVRGLGRWPTKGEFRWAGLSRALAAVYARGGSKRWQRLLGVDHAEFTGEFLRTSSRPHPQKIEAELRAFCDRRLEWPSYGDFKRAAILCAVQMES